MTLVIWGVCEFFSGSFNMKRTGAEGEDEPEVDFLTEKRVNGSSDITAFFAFYSTLYPTDKSLHGPIRSKNGPRLGTTHSEILLQLGCKHTMCTYALWVQHITPLLLPSTGPVCTRINPAYCGGIIMWSMQYLKQSRVCMQYAVMKSWSRPEVLSSNERSHILSFLNATFLSCKPNMFSSERTLPV